MPRPALIPQIYGYLVCLVAVITLLVSASSLVNNAFDLADPLYAQRYGREVPPSFELYREEVLSGRVPGGAPARPTQPGAGGEAARPLPTDAEMRAMYEALRDDKIRSVRHQALRNVTGSALLVVLSIGLFLVHWRWVRGMRVAEEG
jgi:hypothetical protein